MSTPAKRRLLREFRKLQDDPPMGMSGAPQEDNIMKWDAIIFGPDDTPFEGGTFRLTLEFSEEYPNEPPNIRFVTKMFHPNIYQDGSICLDILSEKWSPTFDTVVTLASIQSLLDDPNPHSPANSLAADLFMRNKSEYIRRVAASVEKSWDEPNDNDSLYDDETDTDFVPQMEDVRYEDPLMEYLDWSLAMLFCDTERDVIGPLFNDEEDNILTAIFETETSDETDSNALNTLEMELQSPVPPSGYIEMCSIL